MMIHDDDDDVFDGVFVETSSSSDKLWTNLFDRDTGI